MSTSSAVLDTSTAAKPIKVIKGCTTLEEFKRLFPNAKPHKTTYHTKAGDVTKYYPLSPKKIIIARQLNANDLEQINIALQQGKGLIVC